ncbi:hypothetical protein J6590_024189 [Homalodisca vitripennis]|nr:hypothetical protein J6590_024189 [Homalodisca vitripennis]
MAALRDHFCVIMPPSRSLPALTSVNKLAVGSKPRFRDSFMTPIGIMTQSVDNHTHYNRRVGSNGYFLRVQSICLRTPLDSDCRMTVICFVINFSCVPPRTSSRDLLKFSRERVFVSALFRMSHGSRWRVGRKNCCQLTTKTDNIEVQDSSGNRRQWWTEHCGAALTINECSVSVGPQ